MNIRSTAVAVAAAACLTLGATACGVDTDTGAGSDPKPKAGKSHTAKPKSREDDVDCGPNSDLSQQDWIDLCGKGQGLGSEGETELKVGEEFRFEDGVKVTVDRIVPIPASDLGEYDTPPSPNQNAFRAYVKVTNGSKKTIELDYFMADAAGATNGGAPEMFPVETGTKPMAGRIAPGQSGEGTGEWVLGKEYGTKIAVSVMRSTEDDVFADEPTWTGNIR